MPRPRSLREHALVPTASISVPPAAPINRLAWYAALNVIFWLILMIAQAIGASPNPRLLYMMLLFAICSSPVIRLDGINGRYALLAIFSLAYFVMFGVSDVFALLRGADTERPVSVLSAPEAVVLVGGAILFLSYALVVLAGDTLSRGRSATLRDWSKHTVLWIGLAMWAIGTYATYNWYVYIVTDETNEAVRKGLGSLTAYQSSAYILAQMMQPLGILLIAYFWRIYRPRLGWSLILCICVLQVAIGFVADIKGLAMLAGILTIITMVLIDGRIPKLWLVAGALYVVIVFPIFQTYRTEITHNRGIARTAVVANLGRVLELTLSADRRVNSGRDRAQTFLERSSLLGSLQTIVEKTGDGVPLQGGHTLSPILATFVPKIIWSDKPDIPTGQILNKAFHITDSEDVFISPSHLGELYWNFGWSGVIAGMALIGCILGYVGSRFNLAQGRTVTRLLVTVVTIKQVVVGFESSIAAIYVVWLRSLVGIALLHLIFARAPHVGRWMTQARAKINLGLSAGSSAPKPFPNLLS
jgi:hypothetical protein